jgi:hypothetical protein
VKRSDLPKHLRDLWNPADLEDARPFSNNRAATKVGLRDQVRYSLAFLGRHDVEVFDIVEDATTSTLLVILRGEARLGDAGGLDAAIRAVAPATVLVRVVWAEGEDLEAFEAAWRLGGARALDALLKSAATS